MQKAILAGCLLIAGLSLEAIAYEEVAAIYIIAPNAPPAEKEEVVGVLPGPNYVWIKGHWMWHKAWVWEPGHYAVLPHESAKWVPGHWIERRHGWLWIPGHWT